MLNVSIVLYRPNWEQVINLTQVLLQSPCVRRIYWIDNSPSSAANLQLPSQQVEYRHNLGTMLTMIYAIYAKNP